MSFPGGMEMLLVLGVVMLLFGASRLPKLARSMGQAGKEFKSGLKEGQVDDAAEIEGPCPFCATDIPAEAKFCPGCARSSQDVVAERLVVGTRKSA